MTSSDVVGSALADYFRMIQAELHELVEPISSDQLWRKPYSYGNSIGNLILHLTGNLNYYIGTQIAGTGYVRHRDLEFTGSGKPKDALLREFDSAIEIYQRSPDKPMPTGRNLTRPSANPSPKTGLPPSCAAPVMPTTTSAKSYICKGNC